MFELDSTNSLICNKVPVHVEADLLHLRSHLFHRKNKKKKYEALRINVTASAENMVLERDRGSQETSC